MTVFFLVPAKWRASVLLLASYVFCGWADIRALIMLILISACTWAGGIKIEILRKEKGENAGRICTAAIVCVYILLLCGYKYIPYCAGRFGSDQWIGHEFWANLPVPVGLSFYLFQAIGYLTDICKGRVCGERNFWHLSCYLVFFPKLVSGPIEREQDFLPQIKELDRVKFYDRGRLSTAFTYMLWGYFMKMVVADRLAVTVNHIFDTPEAYDSFWLILGAFFYTMQIYCDFAGYSYIAVGCARIFGINLTQNFTAPYCASSITEFWRRWHISLSRWLRDYLYIPLGGNRKGTVRKCMSTMIVFLVCGMWHGAGINFIAWGMLHGLYSVLEVLRDKKGRKIRGGRIFTFVKVAFAWIFFRAGSFSAAVRYIKEMLTSGFCPNQWRGIMQDLHLNLVELGVIVSGIAVIWAVDELCSKKKLHLPALVQIRENMARYLIFYLLIISIFIFGMYGPGYHTEQFIYMSF